MKKRKKNFSAMGHEKTRKAFGVAGIPHQLSPLQTKTVLPIAAVNFKEKASSLKKIFNGERKIYVTPDS